MPGNINGGQNQEFPIYGINTVTVHTPVVNYSSVSDDAAHNQKTNPDAGRSALILERPFTVRIPTSGQHVSYPGYGNRDYAKYFRTKQVKFPLTSTMGTGPPLFRKIHGWTFRSASWTRPSICRYGWTKVHTRSRFAILPKMPRPIIRSKMTPIQAWCIMPHTMRWRLMSLDGCTIFT